MISILYKQVISYLDILTIISPILQGLGYADSKAFPPKKDAAWVWHQIACSGKASVLKPSSQRQISKEATTQNENINIVWIRFPNL